MKTQYASLTSYVTKDGSVIRELMHPSLHGNAKQSLAEARLPPGRKTRLHKHHLTEELYYIIKGNAIMILGDQTFVVSTGDTIAIPPGTPHSLENHSPEELVLLCCCSPPYSHEDTELLGI